MSEFRWVEHDGQRRLARREIVERTVVYRLIEGKWDERLHPRNRLGKWVDKLGDALKGKSTTLGVTPYLKERSRDRGQAVPASYRDAARLHKDPAWRPLFEEFEQTAERLAAEHGVQIVRGERNVGVFEGVYEPSYAIKTRGEKSRIDAFNQALGNAYEQKAVVGFTPNREGRDAEVRLTGLGDPDAFYADLVEIMGEDAGASYEDGVWRVFVYEGDEEVAGKVSALAKKHRMGGQVVRGDGDYFQLREGEG